MATCVSARLAAVMAVAISPLTPVMKVFAVPEDM